MCGPHHCLGRDGFASGPEILRRLLQLRQNASILEQGCAGFSPGSANRCDQFTRHPGRTSSPLRPRLSCRYTQETIEKLLKVENTDEPTEIVIHVNMLKEGWDVTNLYTIVPLRAANARTLIEQSIGRGLRLPYGKRTGVLD